MSWYLSHFKSMPVAGLKSMSVLHHKDSSVDSPQRAWIAREEEEEDRERELDIGREEEGGYTLSY